MNKEKIDTEFSPEQSELQEIAVKELASELHEDWRRARLKEDGSFEPRIKTTKDEQWIAEHSTDQVDIANTNYEDLPEDWQAENKLAAEVVVGIINSSGDSIDLSNPSTRSEIGEMIHKAWLERNAWAKGGELDVHFDQLPASEQSKDINQITIALDLFNK